MNKKVAAGVAAAVAAASIATNLLVEPEELLHSAEYLDSHTRYMEHSELGEYDIEYTEPEELSRKDMARNWLVRLPVPVKALILLPLWALGAIPVAIGTGVASALAPIWSQILGFVLQAAVLIGVFCLVYKLVFPDRKVRELFKKKNFRWLLIGAVTVTMANFLLAQVWTGWPVVRVILMAAVGFGVLCLVWRRVCGRLKGREPGTVTTKLKLEYE